MKVTRVDINKEVMKLVRKDRLFKAKTNREGMIIMNAITKSFKRTLITGQVLSLGFCWLYPKKSEVFRKRNLKNRLINESIKNKPAKPKKI